jgi:hypothetical protein
MLETIDQLDVHFRLRRVPQAIPADMRPKWRIAILLLILAHGSRGAAASLQKIQALSWIVRLPEQWSNFSDAVEGKRGTKNLVIRYDPAMNRAIEYAIAEGLVSIVESGRIACLPKGKTIAQKIAEESEAFRDEITFLSSIRKHVSEDAVSRLLNWGAQP